MDSEVFDSPVRSLPPSGNRRGALAALLGGALGGRSLKETIAKKKKKKKCKKKCKCPGGRKKLSNGSCAKVCMGPNDCAEACLCNHNFVEGGALCMSPLAGTCTEIPLICLDTTDCPLGQCCATTQCGSNRCIPLCG